MQYVFLSGCKSLLNTELALSFVVAFVLFDPNLSSWFVTDTG